MHLSGVCCVELKWLCNITGGLLCNITCSACSGKL